MIADPTPSDAPTSRGSRRPKWRHLLIAWIAASALVVCIGSIASWTRGAFVESGLDENGWATLLSGLAALVFLAAYVRDPRRPRRAWPLIFIALYGALSVGLGAHYWREREDLVERFAEFGIELDLDYGWGLVMVAIGGASLVLSSVVNLVARRAERVPQLISVSARSTSEAPPEPEASSAPAAESELAGWGRRAAAFVMDALVLLPLWIVTVMWAVTTEDPERPEEITDAATGVILLVAYVVPSLVECRRGATRRGATDRAILRASLADVRRGGNDGLRHDTAGRSGRTERGALSRAERAREVLQCGPHLGGPARAGLVVRVWLGRLHGADSRRARGV